MRRMQTGDDGVLRSEAVSHYPRHKGWCGAGLHARGAVAVWVWTGDSECRYIESKAKKAVKIYVEFYSFLCILEVAETKSKEGAERIWQIFYQYLI